MENAEKIYNIGSVVTAYINSDKYDFEGAKRINISHIEHAEYLYKSADFKYLEEKIADKQNDISNETDPEKKSRHKKKLEAYEEEKKRFIADFNRLSVKIAEIETGNHGERFDRVTELFKEGKFREANTLLDDRTLKVEQEDGLQQFEYSKVKLENNAESYSLKAHLTLLDMSVKDRIRDASLYFEESVKNSELINSPKTVARTIEYAIFLTKNNFHSEAIRQFLKINATFNAKQERNAEGDAIRAFTLKELGKLYVYTNQFGKAQQTNNDALSIYSRLIKEHPEKYVGDVIELYSGMGNAYRASGNFNDALKYYSYCINVYSQIPVESRIRFENTLAIVYNNTANLFTNLEMNDRAIDYYMAALAILEKNGKNNPDEYAPYIALAYSNIAYSQTETGHYDAAKTNYGTALKMYGDLVRTNPYANNYDYARNLCNAGILYQKTGDHDTSAYYYNQSLTLYKQLAISEPQTYLPSVADVLEYAGTLQFNRQNYSHAANCFEEAIHIFQTELKDNPIYMPRIVILRNWLSNLKSIPNRH